MKKIGIWLAAAMAAFYLTATCAFAQTAPGADDAAAAQSAASQAQAEETADTQKAEDEALDAENASDEATDADEANAASDDDTEEAEDTEDADELSEAEAEAIARAEAAAAAQAALRELINSVELSPETTGNEELDALVQDVLAEIITEDMDTYDQVKACYDYLTSNMNYSWSYGRYYSPVLDTTATALFNDYGRISGYGALALSTNSGQCNDYASAFILMTRALGLEVNLANGSTIGSGGGYIRHYWAEMDLDGTRYVFDPQLEQSLARYNKQPYSVFFKTYNQVGGRYVYYGETSV